MQALWIVVVFVFVIGVLATVGFALFELTPFARHSDRFRDPQTGKRLAPSPRLD
jgi:hypothetical protein